MEDKLCRRLTDFLLQHDAPNFVILSRKVSEWKHHSASENADAHSEFNECFLILENEFIFSSIRFISSDWIYLQKEVLGLLESAKIARAWGESKPVFQNSMMEFFSGFNAEDSEIQSSVIDDFMQSARIAFRALSSVDSRFSIVSECAGKIFENRIYQANKEIIEQNSVEFTAKSVASIAGLRFELPRFFSTSLEKRKLEILLNEKRMREISLSLDSNESVLGFAFVFGSWAVGALLAESMHSSWEKIRLDANFSLDFETKPRGFGEQYRSLRLGARKGVGRFELFKKQIPSNFIYLDAPYQMLRLDEKSIEISFAIVQFFAAETPPIALSMKSFRFNLEEIWQKLHHACFEGQDDIAIESGAGSWAQPYLNLHVPLCYFNVKHEIAQYL